jgi:hypothetical protein
MEDTSTIKKRATERGAGARRGAPSRLLRVGDFVGELANEAAQAVRRAGLKPGLERSFGCEAELTGRIVAQEPEPGAELVRNGLVTLFVAAPGPSEETELAAEHAVLEPREQEQPTRALAHARPTSQSDALPRRRKPGRLAPAAVLDIPPAPRIPGAPPPAVEDYEAFAQHDPLEEPGGASEEYVIAADALFASGGPHMGRWPARMPIAWLGRRLRNSPKLLRAALAPLALWLLVAGGAALFAHGSRRSPLTHSPAARARAHALMPPSPRVAPRRPAASRKRTPGSQPRSKRPSRAPRQNARAAVERVPRAPGPSSSSPVTQPAATSSPTPAPRHEGGLFSP